MGPVPLFLSRGCTRLANIHKNLGYTCTATISWFSDTSQTMCHRLLNPSISLRHAEGPSPVLFHNIQTSMYWHSSSHTLLPNPTLRTSSCGHRQSQLRYVLKRKGHKAQDSAHYIPIMAGWGIATLCLCCGIIVAIPGISHEDIRCVPTRWVLALFLAFVNFWSNAPKFRPVVGGGGGMCILFENL